MSSFKPNDSANQMQSCEKVSRGFLVSGSDASKMLDDAEETLDEIAFAIEREIAIAFDLAIGFRRYHSLDCARGQAVDEAVGVISFIPEECVGFDERQQYLSLLNVMDLAAREAERERITKRIDNHVDFRREPAA